MEPEAAGGTDFIVKNTFLEVGDYASLSERSANWRRHMSEPGRMFNFEQVGGSGVEPMQPMPTMREAIVEVAEEWGAGEASPDHAFYNSMGSVDAGAIPFGFMGVTPFISLEGAAPVDPGGGAAWPPKENTKPVLLLAETILPKRGGSEKEQQQRERKNDARSKDSMLNRMKNNDITQREPPWTDVTTVMMRNLPNKYTQQMLLEELQDSGFQLQSDFDFFYLPMDHSNAANLGYCFINFVDTPIANSFAVIFMSKKMRRFNSHKTVVVMPASIQGYERNYAYYSSTRVVQAEDPQYRPIFMRQAPAAGVEGQCQPPSTAQVASSGGSSPTGAGRARGAKAYKATGKGRADSAACLPRGPMPSYPGWPAMGFMMAPWAAMAPTSPLSLAPQMRACGSCGNRCSVVHRFCGFCGSFIGETPESAAALDSGGLAPGLGSSGGHPENQASRRRPGGCGGMEAIKAEALTSGSALDGLPGFQYRDSITEELDVMRGRMMLLSALKDMEKGEEVGA